MPEIPPWMSVNGEDVLVRVKAVPGATRDEIAGALGDYLKIRVSAPPEAGKANAAIAQLLAIACSIPKRRVTLERGPASPHKLFRLHAVTATIAAQLAK